MNQKVTVLIIDPQNDFHEGGSLAVPGALNDCERYSTMIETHLDQIGEIIVTLDSHNREHIAHAMSWNSKEDLSGEEPQPFTLITAEDVNTKWFFRDPSMRDYSKEYAQKLEDKGRFKICIWPYHCIIGTPGHEVVPRLREALSKWEAANPENRVKYVKKGMNNYTEMYSAIEAEVPVPSDPQTQTNRDVVADLKKAPKVLVCGQALSHCVNYTTRDLVQYWEGRDPADIILMLDGASPVGGFESEAMKFVEEMKAAGLTLMKTEDAMAAAQSAPTSTSKDAI